MGKLIAALLGAAALAAPALAQDEPEMRPADSPEPGRVWRERAPDQPPPALDRGERREFRMQRRAEQAGTIEQPREALREFRQERREDLGDLRQQRRADRLDRLRDRAELRQDRADDRRDWRSERGDWRDRGRDWNDGRRGDWDDRRRDWDQGRGQWDDRRRDWDGRDRGDWNDRRRGDWNNGRQFGDWNRGWRQDRRYNWQDWRYRNRGLYRLPPYSAPRGWGFGYRRYTPGFIIPPALFGRNYWILDPWAYRLPPAYGPYRWVRYWDDVLLIDLRNGRVVDVIPDFFW